MQSNQFTAVGLVCLLLAACGGSSGGGGLIDANDPDAVTNSISAKVGGVDAVREKGELPTATTTGAEPTIRDLPAQQAVANGQTVIASFTVDSDSPLAAMLLKVRGAEDFFRATAPSSGKAIVSLDLELVIPNNITDGQFCVDLVALNASELVSPTRSICFDVESTADDPAPSPTPGPVAGGNSAAACFNADLYTAGNSYSNTTRDTFTSSTGEQFVDDDFTVNESVTGNSSFNGRPALEIAYSNSSGAEDRDYYQVDFSVPSVTSIGYESVSGDEVEITDPGHLLRYDLQPGQSYSYTTNESFSSGGFTDSSTVTINVTYAGRQSVTVPAGTFESCRFNLVFNEDGVETTGALYRGVGFGLEVLFEGTEPDGSSFRFELVRASINGTSIR